MRRNGGGVCEGSGMKRVTTVPTSSRYMTDVGTPVKSKRRSVFSFLNSLLSVGDVGVTIDLSSVICSLPLIDLPPKAFPDATLSTKTNCQTFQLY